MVKVENLENKDRISKFNIEKIKKSLKIHINFKI